MATKRSKSTKILTLILMILALNTIYQLPYLMYYYYTPLQEAMGLVGRDADYGALLNVYGIANVILYLPGGWIADKFSAKKLLVFSMVGTGVLGLWESTFPSYEILMLIFVMFAITTVLTFWSSSIKCVNLLADDGEQGGMFGSLEAGRSILGLVVTTLFVSIFSFMAGNSSRAMTTIIATCSIMMIVVGILLAVLMPADNNSHATNATLGDSLKAFGKAFKHPSTYLLAGMIFAASMSSASASYYAPYLEQAFGMSTAITVPFASYRGPICGLIGASLAAVMATKMKRSSKPMIFAGIMMIICYSSMAIMPISAVLMWPLLLIMIFAAMFYAVFRALYYATLDESGVPKNMVGSVIGIASLLGFLPDTFYTRLCGSWLEAYGLGGFRMIFISCIAASALGLVCAFISDRKIRAHQASLAAAK